jgi:hypothetical protein
MAKAQVICNREFAKTSNSFVYNYKNAHYRPNLWFLEL